MSKRAIIYGRVSYDDRKNDALNLQGQIEMGREYCREHGYSIVAELAEDDRGASGAEFDLPELNEALDLARNGKADVLVVRELDRFARGLAKQLVVEQEFRRVGVDVEYMLEQYADTPEGQLQKNVRAVIAEFERLKTKERTVRGRHNVVKSGSVMVSANIPYGYRVVVVDGKRTLQVQEDEAKTIRLIFHWYVEESLSIYAITKRLCEMGIPTASDKGINTSPKKRGKGQWAAAVVSRMLRRETYAGVWHYNKKSAQPSIAVSVEPIIDRSLWERAQERLAQGRKTSVRNLKYNYLMRQRLTCACGYKMSAATVGKYGYYRCSGNVKRLVARYCDAPYFRVDQVDRAVWEWIKGKMSDSDELRKELENRHAEQEAANAPLRERLSVVSELLADNHGQLERLLDLYLDGSFHKELLTERKARLETTIEALERERNGLAAKLEERTLTDEDMRSLEEFADEVRQAFAAIDDSDFHAKRAMIERLDAQVTLAVEDGLKVAYVSSPVLGKSGLLTVSSTTRCGICAGRRTLSPSG